MTALHDLARALFPTARPVGGGELSSERAGREVGWVRILKPRVPAFEALDNGDLGLVFRADRYVDVEREFGALLDDLVAARTPA